MTTAITAGGSRNAPAIEVRVAKVIESTIGPFGANDVVNDDACETTATYWTFSDMALHVGGGGRVVSASIFSESENISPRLTLYLFNAAPTGIMATNSVNTNPVPADRSKYVNQIDFPALDAVSSGVSSISVATPSTVGNLPLSFQCGAALADLYGVLVTRDAFTQTDTDDIEIVLMVEQT